MQNTKVFVFGQLPVLFQDNVPVVNLGHKTCDDSCMKQKEKGLALVASAIFLSIALALGKFIMKR